MRESDRERERSGEGEQIGERRGRHDHMHATHSCMLLRDWCNATHDSSIHRHCLLLWSSIFSNPQEYVVVSIENEHIISDNILLKYTNKGMKQTKTDKYGLYITVLLRFERNQFPDIYCLLYSVLVGHIQFKSSFQTQVNIGL